MIGALLDDALIQPSHVVLHPCLGFYKRHLLSNNQRIIRITDKEVWYNQMDAKRVHWTFGTSPFGQIKEATLYNTNVHMDHKELQVIWTLNLFSHSSQFIWSYQPFFFFSKASINIKKPIIGRKTKFCGLIRCLRVTKFE